jgi:hypothetical protein
MNTIDFDNKSKTKQEILKKIEGNSFIISILLQISPKEIKNVKKRLDDILKIQNEINDYQIFNTFGKHDLLCIIKSDKLAKLVDLAYMLIHSVDGIRDYSKIIGFNWGIIKNNVNIEIKSPGSFTLIKFNLIESDKDTISTISDFFQELNDLINSNYYKKHKILIEIIGCFGWHEIILKIYCDSYKIISDLIEEIRQKSNLKLWSTSSIPIADNIGNDNSWPAILVYSKPGYDYETKKWLRKNKFNVYAKFGIYDFLALPKIRNGKYYQEFLDKKNNFIGVRDTATFVITSPLKDTNPNLIKNSYKKDNSSSDDDYLNIFNERKEKYSTEREKGDKINLKLLSIETIYQMLRRTPIYSNLLPPDLEEMINWVREKNLSPSNKNEFLRHLRYMLQQRFSGSQVEGLLGIEGGLLEQMGGYQKMVFAAESIPFMAVKENLNLLSKSFVVFEHYPEFITGHSPVTGGPIVLHIPMVKYDPHFWILSLHELGEQIQAKNELSAKKQSKLKDDEFKDYLDNYYHDFGKKAKKKLMGEVSNKKKKFVEEMMDGYISDWEEKKSQLIGKSVNYFREIGRESFPDIYACKYVNKETYQKIFLEYADKHGKDLDILLRLVFSKNKKNINEELVNKYEEQLERGEIKKRFKSKTDFFTFIDAYCNLEKECRCKPKCFASFVLSLFNLRIEIQKTLKKFKDKNDKK